MKKINKKKIYTQFSEDLRNDLIFKNIIQVNFLTPNMYIPHHRHQKKAKKKPNLNSYIQWQIRHTRTNPLQEIP